MFAKNSKIETGATRNFCKPGFKVSMLCLTLLQKKVVPVEIEKEGLTKKINGIHTKVIESSTSI